MGRTDSIASYSELTEDDPFSTNSDNIDESSTLFLQLKGQMIYLADWKCVAFLGAPK